jgi:hypothetical protein
VHYYKGLAPEEDVKEIAAATAALCVKDHRGPRGHDDFPMPGDGEVDHRSIINTLHARHPASGFQADLQARPFDPADPLHPLDAAPPDGPVHYAFSTARLSDGGGLLADANLADAQPDVSVSWLIARPSPNPESAADDPAATTATASPFQRRGLAGLNTPLRVVVAGGGLLLCTALIGSLIWFVLRRTSSTSVR